MSSRTEKPEPTAIDVEIRRGSPTEEEIAAVIAVVTEAYAQEEAAAVVHEDKQVSAWRRTQRRMRQPLRRDIPWGRFSG